MPEMRREHGVHPTHTLVTGCSSGIGRATALSLAAVGQHVYAGVLRRARGRMVVISSIGVRFGPPSRSARCG
jgi:hypothetical protein